MVDQATLRWAEQKAREKGEREGVEHGLQQGLQRGLVIGQRLASRLGEMPADVLTRLCRLTAAELEALSESAPTFESYADVDAWLAGLERRG